MRVLIVSCSVYPVHISGVSTIIYNMNSYLKENKVELCAFTVDYYQTKKIIKSEYDGVTIYSVPGNVESIQSDRRFEKANYYSDEYVSSFIHVLSEFKPQIVHFHSIQGMGANLIEIAHEKKLFTILTMHDYWWVNAEQFVCPSKIEWKVDERQTYLNYILKYKVDKLTVVSEILSKNISDLYDDYIKLELVENGVSFSLNGRKSEVNRKVISYFGGLSTEKGYDLVIKAVESLKRDKNTLEVRIYSKSNHLKSRTKFISILKRKKTALYMINKLFERFMKRSKYSYIRFLPQFRFENRERVMEESDIVLVPSIIDESFSLVTREAIKSRKIVIASRCGGPEEIIIDGKNGFLVEKNDYLNLAERLQFVLDNYESVYDSMEFDIVSIRTSNDQAQEFLELYKLANKYRGE